STLPHPDALPISVDDGGRLERVGDVQDVAGAREAHERAADRGRRAAGHVEQHTVQDAHVAAVREVHEVARELEHAAAGHVHEIAVGHGEGAGPEIDHL